MASSETLECVLSSSGEENTLSIEEKRYLPKSTKKKKFMDSPNKTDKDKKTAFTVLLLTNPRVKGSGKIPKLQKLMATSMLFTVFHENETLHAIIWVSEM